MPPETKTQNFSTDTQFSDKTLKKKREKAMGNRMITLVIPNTNL